MEKNKKISVVYAILWLFTAVLAVTITTVTIYNLTHDVDSAKWLAFWKTYMITVFSVAVPIVGLFIIGGFVDLMKLFRMLKQERIDEDDDGFVQHQSEKQKPDKE